MTVQELCAGAADALRERGHAKRTLMDRRDGRVCALGALWVAAGWKGGFVSGIPSYTTIKPAVELVNQFIEVEPAQTEAYQLANWNNAPERTGEEVIAAFLSAAAVPVADAHDKELVA